MIAYLWSQQVMLDNRKFSQVPSKLKEQVKEILIEKGYEDFITE